MATVREGNKAALLVVDLQVGVMSDAWDSERIVANAARAVDRARAAGVPVVWVQHSDAELPAGSAEWQWVPQLVPGPDEPLVQKSFNSAFQETDLEHELGQLETTHIVLAGAATNWCIRATAYGALDRGYDLTLIRDAHTTESLALDDGTKIEASSVIDDLNVCMSWVSYPGRTNGTATAASVDFTVPGGGESPAQPDQ
jgi:nicotinamidase-related amidase